MMTRETKIGMAVAVSFLCLVGVVVATKWRRANDPGNPAVAQIDTKGSTGTDNPAPMSAPNKVVNAGHVEPKPPAKLSGLNAESSLLPVPIANSGAPMPNSPAQSTNVVGANGPPLLPSVPAVADLPPLPVVNGANPAPADSATEVAAKIKKLQELQDKQASLPSLPVPVYSDPTQKLNNTINNAVTNADDAKNNAANNANNLLFKGVGNVNNQLPKIGDTINKSNDVANRNVNDAINNANNFTNQVAQGANNRVDDLFNKGNNQLNKGIDGSNKGLDNLNNKLTLPPPPAVPDTNPPVAPIPTPSAAGNNVNPMSPTPAPMANNNNAFPTLPAPTNPAPTKIDTPAPVIPAPERIASLPPATNNNNNPGFTIPAPPKANDAKVINYDVKSYQARSGDTFASLSQTAYGSDKYANALLAYNRDYSSNRNLTALQPGQTVLFPPPQLLQERYATSIADARPTIPSPLTSIKAPPPVSSGNFQVSTPTTDATKSYRVPGQSQMLYEVAVQTLGDGNRWTEIYRLNPNLQPLQPIPGGTTLRLPGNANVP